jgi:cold shock CspA family protein
MRKFGKTTSYNSRGFGFIRQSSGKSEILFHICDWQSETRPDKDLVVSYEIAPSRNRKFAEQAINVQVVEEAPATAPATAPVDITKAAEVLGTGLPAPTSETEKTGGDL